MGFSHTQSKLQVITRNSDWFIALFATVMIAQSDYTEGVEWMYKVSQHIFSIGGVGAAAPFLLHHLCQW